MPRTHASSAEQPPAGGRGCWPLCNRTTPSTRCSWARLPCGRTSTRAAHAKKRLANPGPQPRRPTGLAIVRWLAPAYLIADRSYDSDPLVAALAARGTCAVILPRHKRRHPRAYAAQRQPVERLFSWLKQFRCVVT
ncbi:MAG: hypothetical protein EOO63_18675 [Hymenobacter sp.]|nr:MAG: hypothetical protein EOO63_18675 [Hymenobacter sp.]